MMKPLVLMMMVSLLNTLTAQSNLVDASDFHQLLSDTSMQKLDVRTGVEFDAVGHITSFEQVNLFDKKFDKKVLEKFDANKPIMVTCFSGHRSKTAVEKLKNLGFKKIYELKGGIINWLEKGYPLE